MKYYNLIIAVFLCTAGFSQKNKATINETSFMVEGVCDQCKSRIESAALRTKGVKAANWNELNKELSLIYNSKKTTEQSVQRAIANSGHSSEGFPVDTAVYSKLPNCCRYEDKEHCTD